MQILLTLRGRLFISIILLAICRISAQTNYVEHIVKPGETLYGIATMYNTNIEALKSANPTIAEHIVSGQKLNIPVSIGANIFHTIAAKETLFSISKKYNVEIENIIKANPGINEQNFKVGETITIPIGKPLAKFVDTTAVKSSGIAGSDCREMYKVKKKDTFFSVAGKYSLSVEELAAANPDVLAPEYKIHKGDFLCIPFARSNAETITEKRLLAQKNTPAPKNKLDIAILMPFYGDGLEAKKCVVFYRGLLAAVDSLRKSGISFDITAKDAGSSVADVNTILQSGAFDKSDMVVTAGNANTLKVVADYCKRKNIRLFMPFESEFADVYNNAQVMLAYQPESYEKESVVRHFIGKYREYNIIYVNCKTTNGADNYTQMLLPSLKINDISYKTVNLDGDDTVLFKAFEHDKRNIVVLSSSSQNSFTTLAKHLDNIAASLAATDYAIFGHKEWIDFDLSLRNNFFKYDVTIITPRYINVFSSAYTSFIAMYKSSFKQTPSSFDQRAFFLGLDAGMYLLKGLTSFGSAWDIQKIETMPIEKPLSFARVNNWGGLINKAYRTVRFTKFRTTEITDHVQ